MMTPTADPTSADLRVVIVEDSSRYRASLEALFAFSPGYEVVRVFETADRALHFLRQSHSREGDVPWDLVLMDVEMPGTNGIEATRQLKEIVAGVKVVVLTVYETPARILDAICAGADGYLLKGSSAEDLLSQIRVVRDGGAALTPAVARTLVDLVHDEQIAQAGARRAAGLPLVGLSGRESEVLSDLVRGLSYKQIADDLCISIDTVRTHIRSIYKKLQVHSVAEAVSRAIREGLV